MGGIMPQGHSLPPGDSPNLSALLACPGGDDQTRKVTRRATRRVPDSLGLPSMTEPRTWTQSILGQWGRGRIACGTLTWHPATQPLGPCACTAILGRPYSGQLEFVSVGEGIRQDLFY